MTKIDETLLIAYADGELDAETRAEVERAIASDPALAAIVEKHRRLRDRLAGHFAPVAEEPVPDALRALIEGAAKPQAEVIDFAGARARRLRSFSLPAWGQAGAIAASLVVGIFAGRMVLPANQGPVTMRGGALVAHGTLAHSLDTQLASAQPGDAAVRIGVSFRDREDRFCRTFDAGAVSGVACRGEEGWMLPFTAASGGAAGGQYRQAASGDALVMGAAEAMMAGEPLDAEAERKARDHGWK